jgi:hypothetical protein
VVTYAKGATIVPQGQAVSEFRIVRDGAVWVGDEQWLLPGHSFGQAEIFARRATERAIRASVSSGAVCVEWASGAFLKHISLGSILNNKSQQDVAFAVADAGGLSARGRRMAVNAMPTTAARLVARRSAAVLIEPACLPSGLPASGKRVAPEVFRAACGKLLCFARLEVEQLDELHAVMVEHSVPAQAVVLAEGEPGARAHPDADIPRPQS